jgi:hypothetical protein
MKIIKYSITILAVSILFFSCKKDKKGCTDVNACNYDAEAVIDNNNCEFCNTSSEQSITFNFTHNYDLAAVSATDFGTIKYINSYGNQHSITKLRYLISDIALHKPNGDSILIDGYNFTDLAGGTGLVYTPTQKIPDGVYSSVSFTWGFDETDNVSGIYTDLNAASWSWPAMLGGGYHFMQFEGMFIDDTAATRGFAYHNGIAREITAVPDTIYHANHFRVKMNAGSTFGINNDVNTSIELKMNIAEWFKNTYQWDLNVYGPMLMPNYNAQLRMNENGRSVFDFDVIQSVN